MDETRLVALNAKREITEQQGVAGNPYRLLSLSPSTKLSVFTFFIITEHSESYKTKRCIFIIRRNVHTSHVILSN